MCQLSLVLLEETRELLAVALLLGVGLVAPFGQQNVVDLAVRQLGAQALDCGASFVGEHAVWIDWVLGRRSGADGGGSERRCRIDDERLGLRRLGLWLRLCLRAACIRASRERTSRCLRRIRDRQAWVGRQPLLFDQCRGFDNLQPGLIEDQLVEARHLEGVELGQQRVARSWR